MNTWTARWKYVTYLLLTWCFSTIRIRTVGSGGKGSQFWQILRITLLKVNKSKNIFFMPSIPPKKYNNCISNFWRLGQKLVKYLIFFVGINWFKKNVQRFIVLTFPTPLKFSDLPPALRIIRWCNDGTGQIVFVDASVELTRCKYIASFSYNLGVQVKPVKTTCVHCNCMCVLPFSLLNLEFRINGIGPFSLLQVIFT